MASLWAARRTQISFRVGSSVQKCDLADIASLKFDSGTADSGTVPRPLSFRHTEASTVASTQTATNVTIPAGTRISVRTIDGIDSTKNHPGDRFQASVEEPLTIDGT